MKKTKMVLVCTLLCCLFAMNVYASEIMPCADDYFISATAFLANNKTLVIDCVTYDVYDQIAVTRVCVERLVR